jgi:hypothetical protein
MNVNSKQPKNACSPAEAVAMKNAALRAVLGYLEYQHGPGEWLENQTAYRFHRMVELALEAPCELESALESRFAARRPQLVNQS